MWPFGAGRLRRRAEQLLANNALSLEELLGEQPTSADGKYDVFLSHSTLDKKIILGMRAQLVDEGLSVYVDTVEDPDLGARELSHLVAERLKARMRQCRALLYIVTPNTTRSRWMPWELGFFDGYRGKVGIVPVVEGHDNYKPDAFDSFYPRVYLEPVVLGIEETAQDRLRVDLPGGDVALKNWLI